MTTSRSIALPLALCLGLGACAATPPALTGTRTDAAGKPQDITCTEALADDQDAPKRGSSVGRSAALILSEGMFRACEAYLNGAIDAAEYRRQIALYPRLAASLMAIEALGWGGFPKSAPAGDGKNRPPTRIEAIEKILNDLNK